MTSPTTTTRKPENPLQNFDVDLQEFYFLVIERELKWRLNLYSDILRGAIKEIVEAYKKENTSKSSSAIRFSTKKRRCAYILKHSPLFTSAVAYHFRNFTNENDNKLKIERVLQKGEISIACLGGGPASEVVAITKNIAPMYKPYWEKTKRKLNLKVTIVDINGEWEKTCKHVLEGLKWGTCFDGVDHIYFDFKAVQADLSKPMSDEVKEVIGNADILTMVYFVSAVNGGKDTEESFNMVKDIMKTIKTGAILFFLDSATDVHYEQMDRAATALGNMNVVYEPCIEYLHCLSIQSAKKFLDLYKDILDGYICMTSSFMSYCVWCKSDENTVNEKTRTKIKPAVKNDEKLTEQMFEHRRKIDELRYNKYRQTKWYGRIPERSWKPNSPQKNWREKEHDQTDVHENTAEKEQKQINVPWDRREIELVPIDTLKNWRDQQPDSSENGTEILLKHTSRTGNYREKQTFLRKAIEIRQKHHSTPENWRAKQTDESENGTEIRHKYSGTP